MLNAVIIEDERLAREDFISTLLSITNDVKIVAQLVSVQESLDYLSSKPEVGLIFSDVQLADGLSFEIFKKGDIRIPVIFITAYNEFIMNAFDYNSIDYLLKPVSKEDLNKALVKYRMLENHFSNHNSIENVIQYIGNNKKKRMIVKKGMENISLQLSDIVLIYTENKIVYVIDRLGKKYIADSNLSDLEEVLDRSVFFRANRQYILNINFIRGFKPFERVKLLVDLTIPELNHHIVISQEMAPQFREWMHNA
jgi:two-component system, LytTR family, response regulator